MNRKEIKEFLQSEELLNRVAFALHYNGWYKDSIEGKFGLKETGADHGRFRNSKNPKLDAEFFSQIQFDENGMSLATDEHGNPYYKRVVKENGEVVYQVDSAIKGWDFLPPSWKQENLEAAKVVIQNLSFCYNTECSAAQYLDQISNIIHERWVARQLAGELGIAQDKALALRTLNKDELPYIKDENSSEPTTKSKLLKNVGRERLSAIWGIENFVSYEELPFEEQLKDSRQVIYAIRVINEMSKNEIDYFVEQYVDVSDKLSQRVLINEQKKSNTANDDGGM